MIQSPPRSMERSTGTSPSSPISFTRLSNFWSVTSCGISLHHHFIPNGLSLTENHSMCKIRHSSMVDFKGDGVERSTWRDVFTLTACGGMYSPVRALAPGQMKVTQQKPMRKQIKRNQSPERLSFGICKCLRKDSQQSRKSFF